MKKVLLGIIALMLTSGAVQADGARQKADILIPERWQEFYDKWGFAPAVRTQDGTVYVSGIISFLEGDGSYEERYAAGLQTAFAQINEVLEQAGGSLDDIVEITSFHMDLANQVVTMSHVRRAMMNEPHPAWTAVGTTALALPGGQTEIKVTAKVGK